MTRALLKVVLWIVAASVAALALLYLLVLFVNRHDAQPTPAALRFEQASAKLPPVAEADNGFVYFMGLSADRERDPAVVGKERISWSQAWLAKPSSAPVLRFPGKLHSIGAARSADMAQLFDTCRSADLACARALDGKQEHIAAWLEREQWFAQRYSKLRAYPHWRETLQYDPRLPAAGYAELLEGQKMLLLDAWLRAGHGDAAGVHQLLSEDMQFWRRNLAHNDTLVAKMVSVAALRNHFTWSQIVLRRLPAARQEQAIPAEWGLPVTDAERAILRPLIGEWRVFTATLAPVKQGLMTDQAPDDGWLKAALARHLARHFLQVQASSNRYAGRATKTANLLSTGYGQLAGAAQIARSMQEDDSLGLLAHGVYNMLGNILVGASSVDLSKYALRSADLEGMRRAALLTAQLRGRGMAADALTAQLGAAPGSPYDGKPFAWDGAAGAVVFTGLADGKFARTAMLY